MMKTSARFFVKNKCCICSDEFECKSPTHPNQKYCSQKCIRKAWKQKHPEKDRDSKYKYANENREKRKESTKKWYENNKAYYANYSAFRRALKLQATPSWLSEAQLKAIHDIYELAQMNDLEVDHIIPLKGNQVSGLHVPWNLQLLTRQENASKNNKFVDEDVVAIFRKTEQF